MMKCVVVLCAIAALAMAAIYNENFRSLCSVSATGVATLTLSTGPQQVPCQMKRVADYGRWDLLGENNVPFATIISRPDLYNAYYWMYGAQSSTCYDIGEPLSLNSYELKEDAPFYLNGTEIYQLVADGEIFTSMIMNGDKLVSETFYIDEDVTVDLVYTDVDYEFVNTDEDIFTFPAEVCSPASSSPDDATTEHWCSFSTVPDELCSFTVNGTATVDDVTMYAQVYRVRNTARYDFFNDEDRTQLNFSVFDRPDLEGTFLYWNDGEKFKCNIGYGSFCPFFAYLYDKSEGGADVFYGYNGKIYINMETHDLLKEEREFQAGQLYMPFSIIYDTKSANYDWAYDDVNAHLFAPETEEETCSRICENIPEVALTATQCSPVLVKVPAVPGCAFEANLSGTIQGIPVVLNGKFYNVNDGYAKVVIPGSALFMGVRCDYKNGNGKCVSVSSIIPGRCGSFFHVDFLKAYGFTGFEYRLQPKPVECPDGVSEGCQQFCLYSDYNHGDSGCHILDAEGRLASIETDDGPMTVTYLDSIPSLSDFGIVLCDGTVLEPPTEDVCVASSSSSSGKGGDSSSSNKGTSSSNKGTSSSSTTNGEESSSSISSPSFYLLSLLAVAVASLLFAF